MRQSKNFKSSNMLSTSRNNAMSNNSSATSFGKKGNGTRKAVGNAVMISPTNHQQVSARSSTRRGNISATSLNAGGDLGPAGITASNFDVGISALNAANNDLLMIPASSIVNPDDDFPKIDGLINNNDDDHRMLDSDHNNEE